MLPLNAVVLLPLSYIPLVGNVCKHYLIHPGPIVPQKDDIHSGIQHSYKCPFVLFDYSSEEGYTTYSCLFYCQTI